MTAMRADDAFSFASSASSASSACSVLAKDAINVTATLVCTTPIAATDGAK